MAIKKGKLVDKDELLEDLRPRMIKIRYAMEEALKVGVPRVTVDRILGFLADASDGIVEDGPEPRANTNGDAPSRV
jgi:hypothetical protein